MIGKVNKCLWFAALFIVAMVSCSKFPEYEPDPKKEGKDGGDSGSVTFVLHSNLAADTTREVDFTTGEVAGEPRWLPEKDGYLFAGWFKDKDCKEAFDFDTEVIGAPMDLYAGYVKDIVLADKGKVARVTGSTLAGESLPNPNDTQKNWKVGGTDLGIIWEMSPGKYGVFFGDTFSRSNFDGDWRSNVLGFTENTDLENGLKFTSFYHEGGNTSFAQAVIIRENHFSFTYIPTAAIELNGKQYMHYMYWEVGSGERVTENYSSFCVSGNDGKTWERNRSCEFAWDSYFGMVALAKKDNDPYCYMLGTKTGCNHGYRTSPAKMARFKYDDILNKKNYEFWNAAKGKWVKGKENEASIVLEGTVGEASMQYLEKYGLWIAMYFDSETYSISYSTAARPQGPWSKDRVLCSGTTSGYSQLYGSFIHPLSCGPDSDTIYWTMSLWGPYNVFLMKADINQ